MTAVQPTTVPPTVTQAASTTKAAPLPSWQQARLRWSKEQARLVEVDEDGGVQ